MLNKIPKYIIEIIQSLEKAGFEAYLVGGCVRDLLMENSPIDGPKDWDIATNAKPDDVQKIFPDGKYENDFGTVMLPIKYLLENSKDLKEDLGVVEITTYRIESKYSDKRHPDEVKFAKTLEEDLSRRDFTVNAMTLKPLCLNDYIKTSPLSKGEIDWKIIDLFDGQKDLEDKIIRSVGNADDRFQEDALRMMRAVRFAVQLETKTPSSLRDTFLSEKTKTPSSLRDTSPLKGEGDLMWTIEKKTFEAIKKNAKNLKHISAERIRDEFSKIILSKNPARGIELLLESKLLDEFMPEILQTIGVKQNRHHYFGPYNTVFAHMLASLEKCPSPKLEVRLASFLHDIGKPKSKRGTGEMATFHGHEYIGAKIVEQILHNLRYSTKIIEKTVMLVKNHMFYYNVDEVGESGVRRVVQKVGLENINDLIDVRIADRLGSGVAKAVPYKLRHFKFMVEKVSSDAISVKQLKINGNDLISKLKIQPGPKIGAILDVLLSQVIDDATLNEKDKLLELANDLNKKDLAELRRIAKEKIEEERKKEEKLMKGKYWVE